MADRDLLTDLAASIRDAFATQGRVRSFWEHLAEIKESPQRHLRSAAQYVRDMFEHFGSEPVTVRGERTVRHRLFDGLPGDPEMQRVVGQEAAIDAVYRCVRNFAMEGRADKMILLHGPNGSAKTTIADLVFKGLEHYSQTPEGALYRFCWVFPKADVEGASLGFGGGRQAREDLDTFAYLNPDQLATTVPSDLKTNPFFLVPREHRQAFLTKICGGTPDFPHRHVLRGDMGMKSRAIYEALLTAHQGDWRRVMRYIRVERFYVSRRYRTAAVTIEPQGSVDAEARQMTADMSLVNLPPALQNLRLYEVGGDLVDANRGVVEFNDFLKRPLEYNKYLLSTTERGTLRLPGALVHLDLVMIGSCNEKQLDAFKTDPNFTSFKGRIELITAPYLLEYEKEVEIYRDQIESIRRRGCVAPHAARAAALWAVLTRLWKPDPSHYDEPLKSLVARLSPLAKALLYQERDPADLEDLSADDVKLLRDNLERIASEYRDGIVYEGRFGASAREMKTILLDASYRTETKCFTPIKVFAQLRNLVKDRTLYDFLKLEPKGAYNDPVRFVDDIERAVQRVLLRELRDSMALVEEKEYDRRFEQYFQHVVAYTRGAKVADARSGHERDPDPEILEGVERLLATGKDIDLFRKNLVGKVGAHSMANPGKKLNFREVFPDILRALRDDFFQRRLSLVRQVEEDFLGIDTPAFEALPVERRQRVSTALENLQGRYGYCRTCAVDMASWALRRARSSSQRS